ncbi:hypothetical protein B0H19DRAFT_1268078 [Mycena capillaripes]|nr:hypothetical protein B0H19DRAFT_1268078 [Mycena capillaripes]
MAEDMLKPDTEGHMAKVTAQLTHHIIVPGSSTSTGAKSKAKPKEKKETKTKEFSHTFQATHENYLQLLKAILLKHGEEKYNVTEKMTYGIKIQLSGVKKGDSIDVNNWSEYNTLAKHIIEARPPKMSIYIEMADIQKQWSVCGSRGSNDKDEDADLYNSNGLSDLDREMAHLRGKLEKKYQNDHNAGYTYIDPDTGTSYPLSPQMMKEWCHAMALVDCGMTKGNALRIKAGSMDWWKRPDVKRKQAASDSRPIIPSFVTQSSQASRSRIGAQNNESATPPGKKVAFERCFDDKVKEQSVADENTWLLAAGNWIPMLLEYHPVPDYEYDADDDLEGNSVGGDAHNEAAAALFAMHCTE